MNSALFCVTYRKDLPWFEYLAKSYAKFASGWSSFICAVPGEDADLFRPICDQYGIVVFAYKDWPVGKTFLRHMDIKCRADEIVPDYIDAIYHIDSDCVFTKPCTPADWIVQDRLIMPYMEYSVCSSRQTPTDIALLRWKSAVESAVGGASLKETMRCLPIPHFREVYAATRKAVTLHTGISFEDYLIGCRNEYPQTFCEFNSLGEIAWREFQSKYEWIDVEANPWPESTRKVIQSWSHGGLDKVLDYPDHVGGSQTARQLFQRLGIL